MAKLIVDLPKSWIADMKDHKYPSIERYMKICEKIAKGVEFPDNLDEICKYKGTGCRGCNFRTICQDKTSE